jgi:glycosyltransferase involved in cell wall biosynthesis
LTENAPSNVIFHGNQSNMNAIWPHIGLVLMPSRYEGLPMAALEAMSYGIPVIASPVGELPELLEKKRGWICDPNNVLSWVIQIKAFSRMNRTERKTLSHKVRDHIAEHYSANAITPILRDCYNNLLPSQTATQAAQSSQSA